MPNQRPVGFQSMPEKSRNERLGSSQTIRDGILSNTILVITGNASGEIVLGTPNGLAELRNNRWLTYATHDGVPRGAIGSLFLDDTGTLWIGTAKGISFLQSGSIHVPVHAPEALYGEILGITENHGWLWITTSNHVLRVRCLALLNDSFAPGDYRDFGIADGLPSAEGVKRSRSVAEDSRGRVWFSLNQGISVLQPSTFVKPAFPATTRSDGMLVDGKMIAPRAYVRVPAGRYRLTFRYAGVNVSTPETLRYRYRLGDVDSGWTEPTTSREIDDTNAAPGRFRFEAMARDAEGRWSGGQTTMTFEVAPAYWQTPPFQVASVAALGLLTGGLYRLRLRQRVKMDLRYHERFAERTRIARELHDIVARLHQSPENHRTLGEAYADYVRQISDPNLFEGRCKLIGCGRIFATFGLPCGWWLHSFLPVIIEAKPMRAARG
jgi:hypothetical protein